MTTGQAPLWDLQYLDSSFGEEKSSDCLGSSSWKFEVITDKGYIICWTEQTLKRKHSRRMSSNHIYGVIRSDCNQSHRSNYLFNWVRASACHCLLAEKSFYFGNHLFKDICGIHEAILKPMWVVN
jgi:hypothetical protein